MNKYRKITVKFKDAKSKFNRVLFVKEDLTLFEIGAVIGESINASFYHFFAFYDSERSYVCPEWINNSSDLDYKKTYLKDLVLNKSNCFEYIYDTGDCWDFECKLDSNIHELDREDDAFCTKGVGYGIWEDRSYIFRQYLQNNVNSEDLEDYDLTKESYDSLVEEFETEFDPEELNYILSDIENVLISCDYDDRF